MNPYVPAAVNQMRQFRELKNLEASPKIRSAQIESPEEGAATASSSANSSAETERTRTIAAVKQNETGLAGVSRKLDFDKSGAEKTHTETAGGENPVKNDNETKKSETVSANDNNNNNRNVDNSANVSNNVNNNVNNNAAVNRNIANIVNNVIEDISDDEEDMWRPW